MIDRDEVIVLWQAIRRAAKRSTGMRLVAEEVQYLAWLERVSIACDLTPPDEMKDSEDQYEVLP